MMNDRPYTNQSDPEEARKTGAPKQVAHKELKTNSESFPGT